MSKPKIPPPPYRETPDMDEFLFLGGGTTPTLPPPLRLPMHGTDDVTKTMD